VADAAALVVIPWLMYYETGSTLALALTGLYAATGLVVSWPVAAVFADWCDRRRVLMVSYLGSSTTVAILALLVLTGAVLHGMPSWWPSCWAAYARSHAPHGPHSRRP
jgi:MFS family permease